MKRITRREALKLAAIAGSSILLPLGLLRRSFAALDAKSKVEPPKPASPKTPRFQVPLPIMPVLRPVHSDATTDYYKITQQKAKIEILPGLSTTIWGYNGQFPGPTIKSRVGRQTHITQINNLPEPVVVHLHGMASPPQHDGYTLDSIPPGKSKEYIYPNDHAATYWYHDHQYMMTAHHSYKGLTGMYIVEDDFEDSLPLPKGDYDVPLIIQDRTFNQDGSLYYTPDADTVLVNGAPWPHMKVANRKYRFRILNASISTAYQLELSSRQSFFVIGTDAGLMTAPVPVTDIRIGPAERYEVIIDFSTYPIGTQVVLNNLIDTDEFEQIMRFDIVRQEQDDSFIPLTLRDSIQSLAPKAELEAVQTREFVFDQNKQGDWVINGKGFDPNFFIATVNLGDVEIWRFRNTSTTDYHLVHLHLVKFRILARNGNPPFPYEQGPKDTVFLDVKTGNHEPEVTVLVKFGPHRGRYMFHCHVIDHEDHDMMAQFKVM